MKLNKGFQHSGRQRRASCSSHSPRQDEGLKELEEVRVPLIGVEAIKDGFSKE